MMIMPLFHRIEESITFVAAADVSAVRQHVPHEVQQ
jgi:hypothetical protein